MKEKIDLSKFKKIPGFEGYLINKQGQVYSVKRKILRKPHVCGPYSSAFCYVLFCKNKFITKSARQLVLLAFPNIKITKHLKDKFGYRKNSILQKQIENLQIKDRSTITFNELITKGYKRIPGFLNYLLTPDNQVYSLKTNKNLKQGYNSYNLSKDSKDHWMHLDTIIKLVNESPKESKLLVGDLGPYGVRKHRVLDKWIASIYQSGKEIYIGIFDTKKEAEMAFYHKFIELRGYAPWKI
jgi:hypothetical protein